MRLRSRRSVLCAFALLSASLVIPPAVSADVVGVTVTLKAGHHITGSISEADGGAPIEGATVYACYDASSCGPMDPQATTDAYGDFDIVAVDSGTYAIVARGPVQDYYQFRAVYWDGVTGSPDDAQAISVTVGTTDITGINMQMTRGTSVQGTLTRPGGAPAVGVRVIAEDNGQQWPSESVTNAEGRFNLLGLNSPDQFRIRVEPDPESGLLPGYLASGQTVSPDPADAAFITAGQSGADATMVLGNYITGVLGKVNTWGIDVMAYGDGTANSATSDVDNMGLFSVGPLWAGLYNVVFLPHPTFDDEQQGEMGFYAGEGNELTFDPLRLVKVEVKNGGPASIHPVRSARPTVRGFIYGDYGSEVPDALVMLRGRSGGLEFRTRSGPDGSYSLRNIPVGTYAMQAQAAGYALKTMPDVTVAGADITGRNTTLGRGYAISGRVVGPGAVPVENAVLHAEFYGRFGLLNNGFVETGVDGQFHMSGLLADDYTVVADPPDVTNLVPGRSGVIHVLKDTVAPKVTGPKGWLVLGSTIGSTVPVNMRWTASDPSGMLRFRVARRVTTGTYGTATDVTAPSITYSFSPSASRYYQVRARGLDGSGNWSPWVEGTSFRVLRTQSSSLTATGAWSTVTATSASGGTYRATSASGAGMTYSFTGRSVGLVGSTGPNFGRAKVYVDGLYIGTIDQNAATPSWRKVQYVKTWSTSGAHKIRIVCLATPGHTRTNLDAIVVVR